MIIGALLQSCGSGHCCQIAALWGSGHSYDIGGALRSTATCSSGLTKALWNKVVMGAHYQSKMVAKVYRSTL